MTPFYSCPVCLIVFFFFSGCIKADLRRQMANQQALTAVSAKHTFQFDRFTTFSAVLL